METFYFFLINCPKRIVLCVCCRLIFLQLENSSQEDSFNTFFPPFSFRFKHENLRSKVFFFPLQSILALSCFLELFLSWDFLLAENRLLRQSGCRYWGHPGFRRSRPPQLLVQDSSVLGCWSLLPTGGM